MTATTSLALTCRLRCDHDINGQRDILTLRPEHDMNIDLKLRKH